MAFDARLTSSPRLEINNPVKFNVVQLNEGGG